MERVVDEGELDGLAGMIAGMIRGNLEADPGRARLLRGARGTVTMRARDVGATVGLRFGNGSVRVRSEAYASPTVEIVADSDDLMAMSTVPLRFGFPDAGKAEGRALTKRILRRDIVVRGLLAHPATVRRLQMLLTVT